MMEINCVITGAVQGVAYRSYVQDAATELSVVGWVKNRPDGAVEVVAQAIPDTLKEFVEYLHEGSLRAKVEAVAVEWSTPKVSFDDFSIKY